MQTSSPNFEVLISAEGLNDEEQATLNIAIEAQNVTAIVTNGLALSGVAVTQISIAQLNGARYVPYAYFYETKQKFLLFYLFFIVLTRGEKNVNVRMFLFALRFKSIVLHVLFVTCICCIN